MSVIGHHATCASIVTDDGEQVYECDCDFRSDVLHAYQNGERAATERWNDRVADVKLMASSAAWSCTPGECCAHDIIDAILEALEEPESDS